MLILAKSVNFGAIYSGLSTVGYTLVNPDGSVNQARATAGIVELIAGTGIYGCTMSLPLGASFTIIWDTGGASPIYAAETFDSRTYQGSGGGVAFMAKPSQKEPAPNWWTLDRKKLLKNLKDIIDGVTESRNQGSKLSEKIDALREKDLKVLLERKVDFSEVRGALKDLSESVSKMHKEDIDFSWIDKRIEKVKILVENQNKYFEPIIDGMMALVESEHLRALKKETSDETITGIEIKDKQP